MWNMFIGYFLDIGEGTYCQITVLKHEESHFIKSQPFNLSKLQFLKDVNLEFSFCNAFQRKNGTSYTDSWKNELHRMR